MNTDTEYYQGWQATKNNFLRERGVASTISKWIMICSLYKDKKVYSCRYSQKNLLNQNSSKPMQCKHRYSTAKTDIEIDSHLVVGGAS